MSVRAHARVCGGCVFFPIRRVERQGRQALRNASRGGADHERHIRVSPRKKFIFWSALIIVSFLGLLVLISSNILMKGFYRIERQDTVKNVARARDALFYELNRINKFVGDYSIWDDTYAFIVKPDPKYIESNLNETTFSNSKTNMLAYMLPSGDVVWARYFDAASGSLVEPPQDLLEAFRRVGKVLDGGADPQRSSQGLLIAGERLAMVISRPIVKSDGTGPSRGLLFAAKMLDEDFYREIEGLTRLSFRLYPGSLKAGRYAEGVRVRAKDPNVVSGSTALADVFGERSLILRVDLPRTIYRQGLVSRAYLLAIGMALFAASFLVFCIMYYKIVSQQRAISQTERRFSHIAHATPDAIILASETQHIIFWNYAAEQMFGYTREEIIGQPWYRLLWDEQPGPDAAASPLPVRGGRLIEFVAHRKDGTRFPVEVSFAQWFQGKRRYFGAIVRDSSERKRMIEELLRSNSELEQYAYIASHDLQEPLRQVHTLAQLLRERYSGSLDEKARGYLSFMADGSAHLAKMVRDLLAYSRLNSAEEMFEPSSCSSALAAALANLREGISQSGARVTHGELPEVRMRQAHLVQLFQNLVDNAIKFRRAGVEPLIHVGARPEGGSWLFRVTDNGIGIDPEHGERIFMVFQRLHGRRSLPGTGIGLAICKKIIELHGGRIWFEPEAGGGASFVFTFPGEVCAPSAD